MKLCEKCGAPVSDEVLKCNSCGANIILTKEQFLENHTIYQKRYKDYLSYFKGWLLGILLAFLFAVSAFWMVLLKSTIMLLLFLVGAVVFVFLAVYNNKKMMEIKKFGNDEYEKYLHSQK